MKSFLSGVFLGRGKIDNEEQIFILKQRVVQEFQNENRNDFWFIWYDICEIAGDLSYSL